MKYIKKFENSSNKYKKYILSIIDNYFYVDEIIKNDEDGIIVRNKYKYEEDESITYSDNIYDDFLPIDMLKNVIYTSDSLEDCHNMLILNIQANKYNL